ncbi:MAG: hypothetical protein HQK51_20665 [Oligoflexia bacterium]|nr:hypothetical protein [Oligoflexia bacterium]
MKYLILDANYQTTGLKDRYEGYLSEEQSGLSHELWQEIQEWVKSYNVIIMIEEREREINLEKINRLDQGGLAICDKIRGELGENVKIEYYSEGLLKKIYR